MDSHCSGRLGGCEKMRSLHAYSNKHNQFYTYWDCNLQNEHYAVFSGTNASDHKLCEKFRGLIRTALYIVISPQISIQQDFFAARCSAPCWKLDSMEASRVMLSHFLLCVVSLCSSLLCLEFCFPCLVCCDSVWPCLILPQRSLLLSSPCTVSYCLCLCSEHQFMFPCPSVFSNFRLFVPSLTFWYLMLLFCTPQQRACF